MRPVAPMLSRRSLLVATGAGLLGAAVAGCRHHERAAAPARDPDRAALAAAAAGERDLVAAYDAAIAASDAVAATRLTTARARHLEHLRVLTRRAGVSTAAPAGPTATPTTTAAPVTDLTVHLAGSARDLGAAATTAVAGDVAAVLASIAAEHGADARVTTVRVAG